MKAKLTLTVEEELIPKAKQYARAKGVSLSAVVESALRSLAAPVSDPPFGDRWRGRLTDSKKDSPRYETLSRRYQ